MMINNKLAVVFPGQGSQSVGMLAEIAAQYNEVQQTFNEASDVLGYDLWQLSQAGPAAELDNTEHTQPALLAASYAIWRILQGRTAMKPQIVAGHSLGEYTALVCANALRYSDAIKLVAARGQFMQAAVAPGVGAMAAIIGLDEATVTAVCQQVTTANEVVSPANFNSVGQIVVAGHKAAVECAIVLAKEQGAKLAVLIPISVPSHCQLMQPAAERLAAMLAALPLYLPEMPVINNVDVNQYTSPESIREGLTRQLCSPVRWVETIEKIAATGVTHVIECGPAKILTGLSKRIDKNLQLLATFDLANLEAVMRL